MDKMRFRQVHLDFHTSEKINDIGKDFKKEQFQEMLKKGHVDSITIFSKCHHGWAYHPSKANEMHPNLSFDLLGAQIEAAHEIGVKTPVYISAGLDEKMARRHPEWLMRDYNDNTNWVKDFMNPGYHQFCFNSPYLDYLLEQVKEVLENYDGDGIFLDIVGVRECYCQNCTNKAIKKGKNPKDIVVMKEIWEETYANYTTKVKELVDEIKPGNTIFHNGGHIRQGRIDLAKMNTHLELESLPTGGWGYQHFPLSARYVQTIGMEFLGMTGKFHNTWGEFGGFKHPNALRYEVAMNLANGAKCSIGDQLHPRGLMDIGTYDIIGKAYKEVEEKEKWCSDVVSVADIALLSTEAVNKAEYGNEDRLSEAVSGCVKTLLEGNYLFDVVDTIVNFNKYKLIILVDDIILTNSLIEKLKEYLKNGGQILSTGKSSVIDDAFIFDFGAKYIGESKYNPTFIAPRFKPKSFEKSSFVMYEKGYDIKETSCEVLADFQNPYFNREVFHFCSHQHTPSTLETAGPGIVKGTDGIYISWNIFQDYNNNGSLIAKEVLIHSIDTLLENKKSIITNLPAQGITTLMKQEKRNSYVNHMIYASPVKRGMHNNKVIEVIEDFIPIHNTSVSIKVEEEIKKIYLAPSMEELTFKRTNGAVSFEVDKFINHQMIVLEY